MIRIYYKDKVHTSFFDSWWFSQSFYREFKFGYKGSDYFQKLLRYLIKKEEDSSSSP
jgi:hypothetical protein